MRSIDGVVDVVVHCAGTPNGSLRFQLLCDNPRYSIDHWHRLHRWYRSEAARLALRPELYSAAYHEAIYPDGTHELGRGYLEIGPHAGGRYSSVPGLNARSIGLCLMGTDKFTEAAWLTLRARVEAAMVRHPIDRISGHRDNRDREKEIRDGRKPKTCPGFSVDDWLAGGMVPLEDHLITTLR